MKSLPRSIALMFVLLAAALVAGLAATGSRAQENGRFLLKQGADVGTAVPPGESSTLEAEQLSLVPSRRSITPLQVSLPIAAPPQAADAAEADCYQLLANPQLDIVEFGDGSGSAEPWVVLEPTIYYYSFSVSPEYSLGMADDNDDEGAGGDFDYDVFGQGFFMPDQLESVTVYYSTAVNQQDSFDDVEGQIWSLDAQGFLDEELAWWPISQPESDLDWRGRFVEITDAAFLQTLEGRPLALILVAFNDRLAPYEINYFDDVAVVACVKSGAAGATRLYLPNVMHNAGEASGPICLPPTETPQDQYNANRGLVQTGATCRSTLSNLDRADYYTFRPARSGPYTLSLRNLPPGTEWSAMIFVDEAEPDYAPGPTTGQCRIGTPGSGDKQVTCNLDLSKHKDYFVKVSAGSTYNGAVGNYVMRITGP